MKSFVPKENSFGRVHSFPRLHFLLIFGFLLAALQPETVSAQVTITAPSLTVTTCSTFPTDYFTLGNIDIREGSTADFSTGSPQTLVLSVPPNFEFLAGAGSVSFDPANISAASISVTASSIKITYSVENTDQFDRLIIFGIKVRGITTTASDQAITRTSGTGAITNDDVGTVHGYLSSEILPTVSVTTSAASTSCSNSSTLIALTSSPSGADFSWTIGAVDNVTGATAGSGNTISQTLESANRPGTVEYLVSATLNGCPGPVASIIHTVNPTATVTPVTDQTICNNGSTAAVIFSSPTTGGTITYNWINSNTSTGMAASGSGDIPSFSATNTTDAPISSTITVTPTYSNNGESCEGTPQTFTITVNPTATVNTITDQVLCNNSSSAAINFSSPTTGGAVTYSWTNSNTSIGLAASGMGDISSFAATNNGTAPVTATITVTPTYSNGGESCEGTPSTFTITVNPTATVNTISDQVLCNNSSASAINFSSPTTGGTVTYSWTNNNSSIGLAASGTGNIASFVATNNGTAPVTATITVTPTYSNGGESCEGTPQTFTITVNPTATVNTISDQVLCNNSSSAAITFSSPTSGGAVTYSWTNNNTSIGLAASGTGNIASFIAKNAGTAPVTATITVTPTYSNGGESCEGTPSTFTITVNPTATVNTITDQVLCNNSRAAAINFSSPATGGTLTYNWINSNTSIGLAASGTGNIASFTAKNAGTAPVTATITVTPTYSNGGESCEGTPSTFTITVNPTATINTISDQVLCNNSSSAAINFGSPTTGGTVTYSWTNSNTSIGLAASGTGNIASFAAKNSGTTPVTATITVTPTYSNGGESCTGTPETFTITVNPTATVNTISNQILCNNSSAAAINFSSPTTAGTLTYSWINSNTSIGLAASGTGNISSFVATNNGTAPVTATITVTPTYSNGAESCEGTPETFTITVNPTATVNTITDQVLCNNSSSTAINFSSPNTGGSVTYSWTNNNTSIGLGASGTGNIASFTAKNTGTAPVTATITVTPTYSNGGESCTGTPQTFTITVNPTGTVNTISDQVLCNNSPAVAINFSSPATGGTLTYSWINSNTSIGLAASGTGNIASFTAKNTGTAPVTATITVTPTYSNGGQSCTGTPETFTITVNPTATANTISNQILCNNSPAAAINFGSPSTGGTVTYSWTNNNSSIGLAASGTGNIASFIAKNAGTAPVTATITVTPTYSNGGKSCTGTPSTFTITVNPTATVNTVTNFVFCNNSPSAAINFTSPTTGGIITYNWVNTNSAIGLAAGGTGNIGSFVAINNGTTPVTATITVTPTYSNGGATCTGTPKTFTITVNPTPTVNSLPNQRVCNSSPVSAISFTGALAGTVYNWTNSAPTIGLPATGSGNIASFIAKNNTNDPLTATIIVTPTYTNAGKTCSGASTSFTIIANPTVVLSNIPDQVVCDNSTVAAITVTSPTTGGTVSYTWTNNAPSIGLGTSGTGNIPAFTASNNASLPITATITVTPTYTAAGLTCSGMPFTFTITVNPSATVNTVADRSVCNSGLVNAVNFTSPTTGGSISYNWVNSTTSIGLTGAGSGSVPSFTAINTTDAPVTATITVTPTFTSGGKTCAGTPLPYTVTVNPTAKVSAVSDQAFCNNATVPAINFASPTTGGTVTYTWTNTNSSIGLGSSGTGDIASFTAKNTGNTPVTATITVTPTFTNNGISCQGTPSTFTITVNPTPTVNTINNKTVCNTATVNATSFSGSVSGTVYNWTNSTPSIGLAASGTGTIPSFIANNNGIAPQTATITVTPVYSNGGITCEGTSEIFTITVNPTATVNTVTNQILCNNSSSAAITFSSPATGGTITYNWTNSNSSIGLASIGSGNIASFIAKNTGNAPVTATITVTPVYSNGGASCSGTPSTFTITVNPTAVVTPVANQTVCNNATVGAIPIAGNVSGAVYNWTNTTTSIGLGGSGTGNIPSFTAINTGNSPVTATITVTPVYTNGGISCTGTSSSFTITVNPTATVTPITNKILCNSSLSAAIDITSPQSGGTVSYTWTNSASSIGLPASGTGNIPSFTAVNNGVSPVSATITVTPTFSNGVKSCAGTSSTFTITVNPTATVNAVSNQTVCSNTPVSAAFSGAVTGTVYQWTNTATSIGLAASGTGSIPSFAAVNNTSSPIIATITVTPVYSNGGVTCSGASKTFTITVNPLPVPTLSGANPICPNTTDIYTTEPGMNNYTWTQTGGTITAGGTSTDATATITWGNSLGVKTIYINYSDQNGCFGATSVTVANGTNSSPTISGPTAVCQNSTGNVYTTQTGKVNYSWTISGGTITSGGGTSNNTATVTWNTSGNRSISVNYANVGGCNAASPTVYAVKVNPLPTATIAGTTAVCVGAVSPAITFTGATGTAPYTFTYKVNNGTIQTVTTTSGNSVTVAQPTTVAGTFIYTLLTVKDASSTACIQSQTGTTTITVNPLPTATIVGTTAVCRDGVSPTITFTGAAGTAPYTFTYTINGVSKTVSSAAGSSSVTVSAPTSVAGSFVYQLVSVKDGSSTACSNPQSGSATVTVNPLPTATITGTTTVCINSISPKITFTGATGTAPYTFTYRINGGSIQTVSTSTGSSVTVSVPTTTAGTSTYELLTVKDGSSTACVQTVSGTAIVTVDPKPIGGTLSPSLITNACSGANGGTISLSGQLGNVVRWEYSITGGSSWATVSPGVTTTTFTYSNLTATTLYRAVLQNGVCSDTALSKITVVVVSPVFTPTVYYEPSLVICVGDSVTMAASGLNTPETEISGGLFDEANPKGWSITMNGSNIKFPANADNGKSNPWAETNGPNTFFTGTSDQITYDSQFDKKFAIVNGPITSTMETPVFSTVGMVAPTLDFFQAFHLLPGTIAKVEISVDGGATYNGILENYVAPMNVGVPNGGLLPTTISLTNYLNLPNLKVRFTYSSTNNSSWAIDNLRLVNTYLPVSYLWHSGSTTYTTQTIKVSPPVGTHVFNLVTQTGICSLTTTQYTVIVNGYPTIEPGTNSMCISPTTQTLSIPYTNPTYDPKNFSLTWNTPSNGLTAKADTILSAGSIPVVIPGSTPAGTYTGNIQVRNDNGCISPAIPFSISINPKPIITNQTSFTVCSESTLVLNAADFVGSNMIPANTNYSWAAPSASGISGLSGGTAQSSFTTGKLINNTQAPITVTYTVTPLATLGGCTGASFTIPVTVNPLKIIATVPQSVTLCPEPFQPLSTSFGVSTVAGTIFQWQENRGAGWVNLSNDATYSGVTSATLTVTNITEAMEGYQYRTSLMNPNFCYVTHSEPASLLIKNVWKGAVSSDWGTPANWWGNVVPDINCEYVIVPKVTGPYPILKGTEKQEVRNMVIRKDAFVTVTQSSILQVRGTIYSNMANYIYGTLDGTDGKIELNGASPHTYVGVDTPQTIAGSLFKMRTLKDLQISNPLNAYVRPTPNDTLNITGCLSFGAVNNSTLYTGDNITLISLSAQTARVADITNNGSNSGNNFIGDVIVERYINTGTHAGEHGKAWEFLATPTVGQTVKQSWMENGKKTATGFGTQITGAGGAGAGFDQYSAAPSMKFYNPLIDPTGFTEWEGIPNTGISIFNPHGYMLFVRGDRSIPGPFDPAIPTRLRTKGKLFTYNVSVPLVSSGFTSIGNPYASAIDMSKVMPKANGADEFFYTWASPTYGAYGYGSYITYSFTGGRYESTPGGKVNNNIESGQAFFVQTSGATSPKINFDETVKATTSSSAIFRQTGIRPAKVARLRTNLYAIDSKGGYLADGTLQEFSDEFNTAIDGNDARKITNGGENLSITTGGRNLIIERSKTLTENDTIFFKVSGLAKQKFRFEFVAKRMSANGLKGYLEDRYLHTSTPLNMEDTTQVIFAVDNARESSAANRFYIVFKQGPVLPFSITIQGASKNNDIIINWNVTNEKTQINYIAERSTDGIQFLPVDTLDATNSGINTYRTVDRDLLPATYYYRIKTTDVKGKTEYTRVIKVTAGDGKQSVSIFPNPITNGIINLRMLNMPAGAYGIRLLNNSGQVVTSTNVLRNEGSSIEKLNWDYRLARGMYQLEIMKPDGEVKVIKVVY